MQTHYDDEYEEVPSPFKKTANRNRSNLFSRPLGTSPSESPTIVGSSRRKLQNQQADFMPNRRAVSVPEVEYIDEFEEEEEEEIEEEQNLPVRARPRSKPKSKKKIDLFPRICWGIVSVLMLRLIFMERGVLDYWNMNNKISDQKNEITRIEKENQDIGGEIRRLTLDKSYQRQITKETLGVIAADEFLILFAGEALESQSEVGRPL